MIQIKDKTFSRERRQVDGLRDKKIVRRQRERVMVRKIEKGKDGKTTQKNE